MKWDTALTQGIHNLLGRISVFIYKHSQIVPRVQEKTSLKKKKFEITGGPKLRTKVSNGRSATESFGLHLALRHSSGESLSTVFCMHSATDKEKEKEEQVNNSPKAWRG